MIKELREVEQEWDRIYDEFEKRRSAVIARMLTVGRKVKWTHSTNYISGTVVELPKHGGDYVTVKNTASGKTRQVRASQLSFDDEENATNSPSDSRANPK